MSGVGICLCLQVSLFHLYHHPVFYSTVKATPIKNVEVHENNPRILHLRRIEWYLYTPPIPVVLKHVLEHTTSPPNQTSTIIITPTSERVISKLRELLRIGPTNLQLAHLTHLQRFPLTISVVRQLQYTYRYLYFKNRPPS